MSVAHEAPVMKTMTGAFVITEREFQGMQVECLC